MTTVCSACGAQLEFKPGADAMVCPYCGAENRIALTRAPLEEIPLDAQLNARHEVTQDDTVPVIACPSCGAQFSLPEQVHSGHCPFCGRTIVMNPRAGPVRRPNGVLPFSIDARKARAAYEGWLKNLWFAPNDVVRAAKTDGGFRGLYLPFWTFDAQTESSYTGLRGIRRYTRDSQGRQTTVIDWLPCSGHTGAGFDDVLVPATAGMPPELLVQLEPWDLAQVAAYDPRPLAGFAAEHVQLPLEQGFQWARQRMDEVIRARVQAEIGGDLQQILTLHTRHADVTFKTLLLPVWANAFRYGGRTYRILVNGQTGQVRGDRPWSWIKIALAVIAAVIIGLAVLASEDPSFLSGFDVQVNGQGLHINLQ